jgi:hypothetical protein
MLITKGVTLVNRDFQAEPTRFGRGSEWKEYEEKKATYARILKTFNFQVSRTEDERKVCRFDSRQGLVKSLVQKLNPGCWRANGKIRAST